MKEKLVIEAYGVSKKYRKGYALRDFNLRICQGEIYGLVGDNGAGKTTFMKMLTGQIWPTEGAVRIMGKEEQKELNQIRRQIGSIIEMPCFYPDLTVAQNMEYYRRQRGIPGKDISHKMLYELGIADAEDKKFSQLSLGMKQRMALALALMNEPDILILDEPVNGLDPSGIVEIRKLLLRLNQEKNITILISSHILKELENIATNYGFICKGTMIEQISARELQEKCNDYIELRVSDKEKFCALLEQKLGVHHYRVLPDEKIHVMDLDVDISGFAKTAVENNINLLECNRKQGNLENYYLGLMKEGTVC